MTATLKQVNPQFGALAESPDLVTPVDSEAVEAAVSPAKALQDKLSKEIAGDSSDPEMSARMVTSIVIAACAMTWVGGVLLYATL